MRRLIMSTSVAALMGSAALAGGVTEVAPDEVVVAADRPSSKAGIVVPLLLLVLIAAAASGGGDGDDTAAASDRRIKTDVHWVGMAQGLPVYRYRYIGTATRFEGVMAQDVLGARPDAVVTWPNGMLGVDYAKLGLRMKVVH